jgi:hypothetical protein
MEYQQPTSMKFIQSLVDPNHFDKFFLKSWGFEYWFENNEKYCGKVICVRDKDWSSFGAFHFHKIKDETFFVISGGIKLDILDLSRVEPLSIENLEISPIGDDLPWVNRYFLQPFQYIRIYPGVLHRFSGFGSEGLFIETSTSHYETDSYRINCPCADDQLDWYEIRPVIHSASYNTKSLSYLLNINGER